jgi:hypothetical protein
MKQSSFATYAMVIQQRRTVALKYISEIGLKTLLISRRLEVVMPKLRKQPWYQLRADPFHIDVPRDPKQRPKCNMPCELPRVIKHFHFLQVRVSRQMIDSMTELNDEVWLASKLSNDGDDGVADSFGFEFELPWETNINTGFQNLDRLDLGYLEMGCAHSRSPFFLEFFGTPCLATGQGKGRKGSKVQRFKGSKVQKCRGAEVLLG